MKELTLYDKTEEYETHIRECMTCFISECRRFGIPCFATCAIKNDEEGTEYKTDGYFTGSGSFNLSKDNIKDCLLIHNGFVAVPQNTTQISLDELLEDDDLFLEDEDD